MAGSTVADYLLSRLRGWEVDTVFAYAGDGIDTLQEFLPHREAER